MARDLQKIIVMGLGYIGLPTASMLATKGHTVVGVDVNKAAVDTINSGRIHIIEPDLDILVRSAVNSGNLKASLVPEEGDTFIIAVPTPFKEEGGNPKAPDLSYVEAATKAIVPYLREDNLIILESTSPVGTTELIERIVKQARPELAGKVQALIVTRGAEGSTIYTEGREIVIPCAHAAEVKDPTGCGDAYRAGLLYGIQQGWDWEITGRLASLMGTLKIGSVGGQNHAPSVEDIKTEFFYHFGTNLPL